MITVSCEKKLDVEKCSALFMEDITPPSLLKEVDIEKYAQKLSELALFVIARDEGNIIGFAAYYLNHRNSTVFISLISVHKHYRHQGIGKRLVECLINSYSSEYKFIDLEVDKKNEDGQMFYKTMSFHIIEHRNAKFLLRRIMNK